MYSGLFEIFIRPVISYGSSIYGFPSPGSVDLLEKISRYFTRHLWTLIFKSRDYPDYIKRLDRFQLDSVELHRLRLDLLLLFKIARGLTAFPSINLRFSTRVSYRILLSPVRSKFFKNHFAHRTSRIWNSIIHDDSVLSMSLYKFKQFISSLNLSSFAIGRAFKA